jgi:hypothetical protein
MSNHAKKRHYDDLTQIKGIGQTTQQWLRETFAVYSYQDLANLSVAELEQALKADGRIPSASRIEQWLSQAAELAVEPIMNLPFDEDLPTPSRWRKVATFVVVFEESTEQTGKYLTNVHHMEADVTYSWDKVVKQELGDWIMEQMGVEIAALADADNQPATEPVATATEPLQTAQSDVDKLARFLISMNALTEQQDTSGQTPDAAALVSSQTLPAASHSEKLQRYTAKVNALSQQPAAMPQPPMLPTASHQPAQEASHSEKLQRYIAKAQTHVEQSTVKQATAQANVPQPMPTKPNSEGTQYSENLQKYVDKVRTSAAHYP